MNVIKLILIIGAIFGLLAFAAAPAMAQYDKVWVGGGGDSLWATGGNWSPSGKPSATHTVHIPTAPSNPQFVVVISSADAACKEIDIDQKSRLEITGKTLTLGLADNPTTSTLEIGGGQIPDGIIRFVKDGSGNPGILKVHDTVTFDGGGTIDAPTSSDAGRIERASGTGGIVINPFENGHSPNAVCGNITFYCNVTNKGLSRFGTIDTSQTMVFGKSDGGITEPEIAGQGDFNAYPGKIQFTRVTFASSAPDWLIWQGEIEVTDDADSSHWVDVPFDVTFVNKNGGLLDLKHNFSCTGTLSVAISTADRKQTIFVASGKIAEFKP